MQRTLLAFVKGLTGVFHPRMLLLTLVPFLLAGAIWAVVGWFLWDDWIALLSQGVAATRDSAVVSWMLKFMGGDGVRTLLAPLLGMLLVVPLVAATALVMISVAGMPFILRHVGERAYPTLARRRGASLVGSVGNAVVVTALWALLWIITIPLWFIPLVGAIIPLLISGWATSRLMSYDALAEHADAEEHGALRRAHRWPLFALGVLMGCFAMAPTLLWMFGALAVLFLPVTALVAIWLYAVVFVISGLAFAHYSLGALAAHRAHAPQTHKNETAPLIQA
jgi:hypothetical protein